MDVGSGLLNWAGALIASGEVTSLDAAAELARANLLPARLQMALTLGFHIVLACFGVGMPVLMLAAEWRYLRTGAAAWKVLARRWSKAFAVLFAIGAVSGTVLSFELGLLWPEFMGRWGAVIGLPFTMEGFAFFLEAIFAGIYLYGWDRLPAKVHWWCGVPVAVAGFFSALFVVTANAWMNAPTGYRIARGEIIEVDPVGAMMSAAAGAEAAHMIVAAYLVTGFSVAAYYGVQLLRDAGDMYSRRAMGLGLLLAVPLVPVQMAVGDWAAKVVAKTQPVKLAAMEGQFETERGAALRIGGVPDMEAGETRYAVELPGMLSWLAYGDFEAEVRGLEEFASEDLPPVPVVHYAFQVMVGIGSVMLAATAWSAWSFARRRAWPESRWFLWLIVALGPLSVVALEAGWVVTEVGRQPWIVAGEMRTAEAVTTAPGVWWVLAATLSIYTVIGTTTVVILRQLGRLPIGEVGDGAG